MVDNLPELQSRPRLCASLPRRIAAIFYDLLLLGALLFVATAILLPLNAGQAFTSHHYFYPLYLLLVSFGFYGWFWTHGGQTLGLRAWNLKVQTFEGNGLTWRMAAYRFLGACVAWCLCLGLGFFWLLISKNRRTWYDSWSGTAIYKLP